MERLDDELCDLHSIPETEHPAWATHIQPALSSPPAFVRDVQAVTSDQFGRAKGRGWIIRMLLMAPDDSPYARPDHYPIEVVCPAGFPATERPSVRFGCKLMSPYVEDDCLVDFKALQVPWPPAAAGAGGGRSPAALWAAVEAARLVVSKPEDQPWNRIDMAGMFAFWQRHESSCSCPAGQLLPCDYSEYEAMPQPQQQATLAELERRVQTHNLHMAQQLARTTADTIDTAVKWPQRSAFPEIYQPEWKQEWFAPSFLAAIASGTPEALRSILHEETFGVWSFDLFTPEFCDRFAADLSAHEASDFPKHRPNSMNNYGCIVDDIGLEGKIASLIQTYFQPLVQELFHSVTNGYPVDHHHAFIVQYAENQDRSLDMHTDDSEVTVNVALNDGYTGSGLSFCGLYGAQDRRRLNKEYQHTKGRAVIHAGIHTHGADDLVTGERMNLIVWMKSSWYRHCEAYHERYARPTLQEFEPEARCLSRTHDRDYDFWMGKLTPHAHVEEPGSARTSNAD